MDGEPLTDDDLRAIVEQEIRMGLGDQDDELADQRTRSMDYYLGKPFGNEVEGRSQVVSRDVADTINGIMPSLLEIFCSGEEVVRFDPVGPEDEEAAEQATEYCNFVLTKDNNAFLYSYQWFKDALIQKNGFIKVYWDTVTRQTTETYRAMPDIAFTALMAEVEAGAVEIVAHQESVDPMTGQPVHFVRVRKSKSYGCPRVENVPPEEFVISREARLGHPCRFMAHRCAKPISELYEMGYDRDKVDSIPAYNATNLNDEALSRDTIGESDTTLNESVINKAMRLVWITEAYIRVDYDGDGLAELRRVVVGGDNAQVLLENEEVDDDPFCVITPEIMSHRFFGRSVAELVEDIQLIMSTLQRQSLDNLYLTNAPMTEVVDNQVNLDDLMTRRPGGVVRVKTAGAMREIVTPFVADAAFPMIEFLQGVKENRTGVTRYNQGLDGDSLNKTARGINTIMSAAQQRIKLIARIFAETGWKQLAQKTHALTVKYQNEPRIIRLRNKFVPIDPRNWSTQYDMTVSVGLGTGDRNTQAQQLEAMFPIDQAIIQMQGGAQGPLLTMENIYNKLKRVMNLKGFKNEGEFYTDPAGAPPPPPPPPDPKLIEVQGKQQIEQQKLGLEQMKAQAEIAQGEQKMALEAQIKAKELEIKEAEIRLKQADLIARAAEADQRMGLERDKATTDANLREREHGDKMGMEREKLGETVAARRAAGAETPEEAMGGSGQIAKALEKLATGFEQLAAQVAENTRWVKAEVEIVTDETGEPIGRRLKPEAMVN